MLEGGKTLFFYFNNSQSYPKSVSARKKNEVFRESLLGHFSSEKGRYTLSASAELSVPLEHHGGAGGVVDLDIVVCIALVILSRVGEVFAADYIATLAAEAGVVGCKFHGILSWSWNLGDIVWYRRFSMPIKDKEQVAV